MTSQNRALLSIVIPVYFNERNIPVTFGVLRAALEPLSDALDWEVIFVDDGSGDQSYEAMKRVFESCTERVRLVKLTRNFGQIPAILAGFQIARGQCCVAMSADLQDPPELIPEMVKRWNFGERKIVLATRTGRTDGRIARWTSRAFYGLMRRYALPNMPKGGFDFFLLDRCVVDLMKRWGEKNSFIQGQILWTGYEPEVIGYTRREREIGHSQWSLSRKVKYFVDGFVTYSSAPIRLITSLGLLVSLLSFSYAVFIFFLKIFYGTPVEGWAPLMITILFLGGLQLVMLGIIGEYLWRSYHETRRQPNYVIESVVGANEPG
jgi:polyisoprenyl-phosphate glycosyltransferase